MSKEPKVFYPEFEYCKCGTQKIECHRCGDLICPYCDSYEGSHCNNCQAEIDEEEENDR